MDRLDRIEKIVEELSLSQKETDSQQKETDRQLKNLGREIGGLGNTFGRFTEGFMLESLESILRETFHLRYTVQNAHGPNRSIEYDPLIFPEHKDKKLFGAIAAVTDKEKLHEMLWKEGLYYFCASDDVVKLNIPKGFKPKNWAVDR